MMKVNFQLLIILFFGFVGCKSSQYIQSEMVSNDQSFDLSKSSEFFFPIKTEKTVDEINVKLDTFQNRWYSNHLYSLKEPILHKEKSNFEIYRYTNLGTWSNPFSYRVAKSDSVITITKKRTDGQGGYETGTLTVNQTKSISKDEWENLTSKITRFKFWTMPTHVDNRGLDGSEWILEGYKDGQYHFLTRWTPNHFGDKDFTELCEHFEKIFK